MRKTVHRLFWAWDFDKEERWLNDMAAQGLSLVSVGFCRYDFERTTPGEYGVRLQLLPQSARDPHSEAYIDFLEETGVEHVGTYGRWAYFRRKKEEGEFELFSDQASRLKHLTRILQLIAVLGAINAFSALYNLILFALHRMPVSLLGLINLALSLVLLAGCLRLERKRRRIKADQKLFE